jgi:hypothetical protein
LHADDLFEARRLPYRVHAGDDDAARIRRAQPLDHLQGCGLAGAVRPQDAEYFPISDLQIDMPDCHHLAVALAQIFNGDDRPVRIALSSRSHGLAPHDAPGTQYASGRNHAIKNVLERRTFTIWL